MLRRLLAIAVLAGAAVSLAFAVPAAADPLPGPLGGGISPGACELTGGMAISTPIPPIVPFGGPMCVGGASGFAPIG